MVITVKCVGKGEHTTHYHLAGLEEVLTGPPESEVDLCQVSLMYGGSLDGRWPSSMVTRTDD